MVLDLFTGRSAQVGSVQGGFGYPSFLGDESGLIYAARDANAPSTGFSLVKQDLAPDRLSKQGEPALWYLDAPLGIIYRRGDFQATNDLPTVTLSLSSASAPAQGNVTLTAAASDADGSVAKVEFYNGSEKLGEATAAPYTYAWSNLAPGTYRLVARAIDNVGGSADSAPATLSVGAPAGDGVKIRATALEKGTIRLVITGAAGSYIIQQSTDLKTWVDIYPVTIDNQGTGRVDDSGGPMNNSRLFYRVRRD
jgi:hypothetical protein